MLSSKHKPIIQYKHDGYRVVIDYPTILHKPVLVINRSSSNDDDDTKVFWAFARISSLYCSLSFVEIVN